MGDQHYLISYQWSSNGVDWNYGLATHTDPIEWLLKVQEFSETYILINAFLLTEDQFSRCDGWLKGM